MGSAGHAMQERSLPGAEDRHDAENKAAAPQNTEGSSAHQPSWSMYCRRISMGGCAPYVSGCGMFMSSTITITRLPAAGPNTPLRRRSSFASTMCCVMLAVVRAEKPITIDGANDAWGTPLMYFSMYTDLPVPVGPTKRHG